MTRRSFPARRSVLAAALVLALVGCDRIGGAGKPAFKAIDVTVEKLNSGQGALVSGVFISVDPERDTGELLKAYMANFGTDFVGLRGTPEQIAQTAKEFKVFYAKVPGKTDTSYTIDHTAGSYVFDTQGRIRLFTRYGSGAKALADDLKLLLAETT